MAPSPATVRPATASDAAAILAIYNHYILNSVATFEETPLDDGAMLGRMQAVWDLGLPWLVATLNDEIVGYAYAARWKERQAYRFSVETTVYLAPDWTGHGAGSVLYRALIPLLRDRNIHVALGGIALPNDASVRLHERMGFEKVAQLKEVGFKFGKWIDVGYWELVL